MQTQNAPTDLIFKLWPWLEANRNKLIGGAVAIAVAAGIFYYATARQAQKEIDAGEALTQLLITPNANASAGQIADAFTQLAGRYSGTVAGKRAQLQAAASLFEASRYADAQAQFQIFLAADSSGPLAASAQLGVATCLEAQGKLDDAATAYRKVTSQFADSAAALSAKFSLGRLAEAKGNNTEAMNYYQEIARNNLAGSLAQEAAMRAADLKTKLASATKPAAKS